MPLWIIIAIAAGGACCVTLVVGTIVVLVRRKSKRALEETDRRPTATPAASNRVDQYGAMPEFTSARDTHHEYANVNATQPPIDVRVFHAKNNFSSMH
jgi:hypothetical protein